MSRIKHTSASNSFISQPYIRCLNGNLKTSRVWKLNEQEVNLVVNFLSDHSLTFLNIDKETAICSPSIYSGPKMPSTKKSSSKPASKKAPRSAKKGGKSKSKSPPRRSNTSADAFHKWDDVKEGLLAAAEGEKYDDTFELSYGHNKDTPWKWVTTSMKNMEIHEKAQTCSGALFEAFTTEVHPSSNRAKFYLRKKNGEIGIHVLRPSSYESFTQNIHQVEEIQEVMYGPSISRQIARQQSIVKIKNDVNPNYAISEFYCCPPGPVCEIEGKSLEFCRDHFHNEGEDGMDEDEIANIPLTVAKKIVPGDVNIVGRYVEVDGVKVPVSVVLYSFQLACKDSEQRLELSEQESSEDDSESDDEMRMQNEIRKKMAAKNASRTAGFSSQKRKKEEVSSEDEDEDKDEYDDSSMENHYKRE